MGSERPYDLRSEIWSNNGWHEMEHVKRKHGKDSIGVVFKP